MSLSLPLLPSSSSLSSLITLRCLFSGFLVVGMTFLEAAAETFGFGFEAELDDLFPAILVDFFAQTECD